MTGLTITSNSTAGYYLGDTGFNPVTVAAGVTIENTITGGFGGLYTGQPIDWTITNYGTLLGTAQNTISDGVLLFNTGGTITNAAGGSITGYDVGVSITGSGTVVNSGTIATEATSYTPKQRF